MVGTRQHALHAVSLWLCLGVYLGCTAVAHATPRVLTARDATPRERYAAERLRAAVAGLPGHQQILLAQRDNALLRPYDAQLATFWPNAKEAFVLRRLGDTLIVAGYDASGTLYGALELAQRILAAHALPATLDYEDHPQLKLRGTAIGMQKPEITYEGAEYDYPYTPQNFPFFYDKAYWSKYLDMLASERINTLYLWSGHPFTSLLRLPRYPEAQELPTAQLEQNIAMFHWLTEQADRRGIWVLQGFYNIHLSHAFARAHHVPYHLGAPTPLASEYTRYAVSEFIREYPNVGLMMTLGEAMGPHYGPEWLTGTIIPGVKDGLAELEQQLGHPVEPPPIVVRAHATDIDAVMAAARPLYANIDTMYKWNGESLTWTNVRGPVRAQFERLVAGSNVQIANVHILSNLEPFRWGDPDFIRQTVLNFERIGIGGAHIYPLRFWDWPVSADNTSPLLEQTDRDWIWYEAWARYAWNPNRDPQAEAVYWAQRFADRFGSEVAGQHLLAAYELSGVCAPRLLPRIGITEGNRQVFSLGMTMPQLIDAARFNPAQTLWTGDAPDGERLVDYVAAEAAHKPHHGDTPIVAAQESAASAARAVQEAEAAASGITRNQQEYQRIVNDMRAIAALMAFYNAKTQAAADVMLFGYDRDPQHLHAAEDLLRASVEHFRTLVQLTDTTYRDAAAMHTTQRQIPVRGGPSTEHFRDLLPVYEHELATFHARLQKLGSAGSAITDHNQSGTAGSKPLAQVPFTLSQGDASVFPVAVGEPIFNGSDRMKITALDPSLVGLRGIRLALQGHGSVEFSLPQPAQVLIGTVHAKGADALNLSSATEQWNIAIPDALRLSGSSTPVTAWTMQLPAGRNQLALGAGSFVVLGFLPASVELRPQVRFDASAGTSGPPNLDWLFED
ncbi:MAG: hypothetical protein KGK08_09890 [Acidobacteriota bacterium]|nr:hypothetical protein [Acidobacteriota bacterium]